MDGRRIKWTDLIVFNPLSTKNIVLSEIGRSTPHLLKMVIFYQNEVRIPFHHDDSTGYRGIIA